MDETGSVIISLDATNDFNCINRKQKQTLQQIHNKVPELYLNSPNSYDTASYTVINDFITPTEVASSQGCPLAGTVFNPELSKLIDAASEDL